MGNTLPRLPGVGLSQGDGGQLGDTSVTLKPSIFGIRHHGPGSARALLQAFEELRPDAVLVEGPPDADELIPWLTHPEMEPPVALLVYRPDEPKRAAYFPFAAFSPELQALRYGLEKGLTVRFMDLPQAHRLAVEAKAQMPDVEIFRQLAQAAGHSDYEAWWNLAIEQRQDGAGLFEGVLELMGDLRRAAAETSQETPDDPAAQTLADQREAYMRRTIREAIGEGHQRIAVVCGAWHGPALADLESAEADDALLSDLQAATVDAAWVPWTYGRLAGASGYGAGIRSPGWYQHLWRMGLDGATPQEMSIHWLTRVAELMRGEALDASSAHIIEAVRLAESLAAMRGLPFPGLPELNEATQTVLCFGDSMPMRLISRKLIVGELMGMVPPDTPMVPLQRDLLVLQRQLRLRPEPEASKLRLDLRTARHLERSHLLHRLNLLGVPWGKHLPRRGPGTFQELWQLQWLPEFAIRIIEASVWGNTVQGAAASFAQNAADEATNLPALTHLLDQIILAGLPETLAHLMARVEEAAALSSDIPHMMAALPPLAQVLRYGDVRQTDQGMIRQVVNGLLTRICIGLPSTCASLDDEAAAELFEHLTAVQGVVNTLQNEEQGRMWEGTLRKLVDQERLHGLLAGRACRLLLDSGAMSPADAATRMERALTPTFSVGAGIDALNQMAAWIEGFLRGSGLLLLHDELLWRLLDGWLSGLEGSDFQELLPFLRRTFADFSESARQQMLQRARHGAARPGAAAAAPADFDHQQAAAVLPLVGRLLGLNE